ncbi:hypothetical protein BX666DRAFT_1919433 [Dichotomocladium elegans]|nr:hypothetical protein BX666DRAFT_1919433 [Dichotomocladium elegans]
MGINDPLSIATVQPMSIAKIDKKKHKKHKSSKKHKHSHDPPAADQNVIADLDQQKEGQSAKKAKKEKKHKSAKKHKHGHGAPEADKNLIAEPALTNEGDPAKTAKKKTRKSNKYELHKESSHKRSSSVVASEEADQSSVPATLAEKDQTRTSPLASSAPAQSTTPQKRKHNSDEDSEDSEDEENNKVTTDGETKKTGEKTYETYLYADRLTPFWHTEYVGDVDPRIKYAKNVVLSLPKVHQNYFISDSESETDSEDDYSKEPEVEWHRSTTQQYKVRKMVQEGKWKVQQGVWFEDERIRLEKRLKKIGRRHGLSLEDLRQYVFGEKRSKHMKFWQQVAKPFPDRDLRGIIKKVKETYFEGNYGGRFTKEEDEKLMLAVAKYGNKFKAMEKELGRSHDILRLRYQALREKELIKGKNPKKGTWSPEEEKNLVEVIEEYRKKFGEKISWEYVVNKLDVYRTPEQARRKWHSNRPSSVKSSEELRKIPLTLEDQLALFERMKAQGWKREADVRWTAMATENFSKERVKTCYIKARITIPGFEKMNLPDILDRLIKTRRAMVESLK